MARFLKYAAAVTALLILLIAVAGGLYLNSSHFENLLRSKVVSALEDRFAVRVELGGLHWTLRGTSVRLENLRLFDVAEVGGPPAIDLPSVVVDYSFVSFLQPKVSLDRLELIGPRIRILETDEDRLNLSRMFVTSKGEGEGRGLAPFIDVGIRRFRFQDAVILYRDTPFLVDSADGSLRVEMSLLTRPPRYGGRAVLHDFALKVGVFELPRFNSTVDFELFADSMRFPAIRFESEVVRGDASGILESLKERTYEFESRLVVRPDRVGDLGGIFSQHEVGVAGTFQGKGGQYLYTGRLEAPRLAVFKIPLSNLSSHFRLDGKSVVTEDLSAGVAGGSVRAAGELSWDEESPSAFSFTASRVDSKAAARLLSIDWYVPPTRFEFEGRAEWPGLRFADLRVEGTSRFTGTVETAGYTSPDDPVPFEGESPVNLDLNRIVLGEGLVRTPGAEVRTQGWVDYSGPFSLETDLQAESGGALLQRSLRWDGAMKDRFDPISAGGGARARILWSREGDDWRAEGGLQVEELQAGGQLLGALQSDFRLTKGAIEFEEARLLSPDYRLDGSGLVAWDESQGARFERLEIQVAQADLRRVAELAQLEEVPRGRLSGRLNLVREDQGYQADGQIDLGELLVYGQELSRVSADLNLRQSTIELENLLVVFRQGRLHGRAGLGTSLEEGTLSLRGEAFPLEEIEVLSESVSGPADIELELRTGDPLTGKARVEAPRLELLGRPVEDFRLEADTRNQGPNRAGFGVSASIGGQPFEGSGQIGLEPPFPLSLRSEFDQTPLRPLLALMPVEELPPVEGRLSGAIQVEGDLGDWKGLQGRARFPSLALSFRGVEIKNSEDVALELKDEVLQISPVTFVGRGTELRVEGTLSLAGERTLQLKTQGNVNLILLNPFLDAGSMLGGLQLETVISGPLAGPRIVGEAQLERGFLNHPSVPTTIFDSRGKFRFTADQVSIESLQARTIYGTLRIDGGVFLEGFAPVRWLLNIYGDGLRLEYPDQVFSTLDVDLDLIRSETSQLLSGSVTILSTDYRENISLPELILRYGTTTVTPPTLPGQEVVLDIDVEGFQTLRLQNNLADLVASGDLHLRGTLTNPVVLGTVTVDEGKLFLENNEYEINRGAITFNNPRRTRPVFNFEAETEVRDISVNVLLNGPIDQLNMSVRSDPPLPTSSIISLLALGQTEEEILGGDSVAGGSTGSLALYGAGALLSKSLGQRLQDQTSRLFGFEKLSIDPFLLGSERDPGARVTLGKQLGRNLSVTYSTVLGSEAAGQVVVVELKLTDWLSAVGTGEQSGAIALDFKLRKRF